MKSRLLTIVVAAAAVAAMIVAFETSAEARGGGGGRGGMGGGMRGGYGGAAGGRSYSYGGRGYGDAGVGDRGVGAGAYGRDGVGRDGVAGNVARDDVARNAVGRNDLAAANRNWANTPYRWDGIAGGMATRLALGRIGLALPGPMPLRTTWRCQTSAYQGPTDRRIRTNLRPRCRSRHRKVCKSSPRLSRNALRAFCRRVAAHRFPVDDRSSCSRSPRTAVLGLNVPSL